MHTQPRCEVCGEKSVVSVHDLDREGKRSESHHYCRKHNRPSAVLEDFRPSTQQPAPLTTSA
jgi:hypothetical protein